MLRIDAVSFRYPGGAEPVLREVTLDMPSGGIFGLLGPNGAGKTTLISIIAGQLRGASGRVLADGEPIEELRRREPRSLGLVPQEFAFYPVLSCAENLRFFGGVQGLAGPELRARVEAVAAFARIESVLARRSGELSGGLKRRLNLAIGLLAEPRILLLDEPTVGVDPQSRAFLLESIRGLAAAGRTVIYTSHYMEEIQALCDHVAIIDYGRVLAAAPLEALLRDDSGVVTLRMRAPDREAFERAVAAARAAGCEPLAVDYGSRDLEQVFMQLTSRSLRDQ